MIRIIRRFFFALFLIPAFFACEQTKKHAENALAGDSGTQAAADSASGQPETAGRDAVLIRGNYWTRGVLGFDENGFSVLIGDYRISNGVLPPGETAKADAGSFSVSLTMEPIYFSDGWQPLSARNLRVFQRSGEDGFFAAIVLDDGLGTIWTAVFHFPLGLEGAGLALEDLSLLLRAWADSFLYFLSLSKTPTDLSLPAALEF